MKKILFLLIPLLIGCASEQEVMNQNKPVVKTRSILNIATTSFNMEGEIVSDSGKPVTAYGFYWSTVGDPIENGNYINVYNPNSTPTLFNGTLSSLQENTTHYVRAYAINSDGISYGNMLTATTLSTVPVNFTTKEITDIAASSASTTLPEVEGLGNIPYTKGVCYATTSNPTISNNLVTMHVGDRYVMKNLTPNTTYHVRAYFTNTQTNATTYGQDVAFTTLAPGTSPKGANYICDGIQITTVVPVTSPSGRIWMDRNLGASKANIPSEQDWSGCIGGKYQWGRGNDGHASIFSETINVPSNSDTPGHDKVIIGPGEGTQIYSSPGNSWTGPVRGSYDWRVPKNDNLWQGVNGINNPCPAGYRIPTKEEFEIEFAVNNITSYQSGINSPLKIIIHDGVYYWTSTKNLLPAPNSGAPNVFGSYYVLYDGALNTIKFENYGSRQGTFCVRCIKD